MAMQYQNSEKDSSENVIENTPARKKKGSQWFHTCSPQYLFLIIMLIAAVLVSLVTLVVFLTRYQPTNASSTDVKNLIEKTETSTSETPTKTTKYQRNVPPSTDPIDRVLLSLKIVSRREWLAEPPVTAAEPLLPPVPYVFITNTATESCENQGVCTFFIRYLQSFDIDSKGRNDIRYNFLVGGDGFAYEGRGWRQQGVLVDGYDSKSIGIGFIGSFNKTAPPIEQISAAKQLINIGVEKGYIDANYKLLAPRQVPNTYTNLDLALYQELQKWPHWTEKP